MLFAQTGDDLEVEGVTQGVGKHDRFGPRAYGLLNAAGVNVVGAEFDINEDGDGAELQAGWPRNRN